jgi:hypothetical protein
MITTAPGLLVRPARNTAQPLGITLWINALLGTYYSKRNGCDNTIDYHDGTWFRCAMIHNAPNVLPTSHSLFSRFFCTHNSRFDQVTAVHRALAVHLGVIGSLTAFSVARGPWTSSRFISHLEPVKSSLPWPSLPFPSHRTG